MKPPPSRGRNYTIAANPVVLGLGVLVGWVAVGLANWMADVLPRWRQNGGADGWRLSGWAAVLYYGTMGLWPAARGKSHNRETRWQRRTPLLGMAVAATFVVMGQVWGDDVATLALGWCYAVFLWTVLVIDLEHRRVLNVMVAPAAAVALLVSLLPGDPGFEAAVLGGLAGFGAFLLLALLGRGKMGAGDVKLAGVIGLMVGYPAVAAALFLGILLGGGATLVLILTRKVGRKDTIAYAPYLSLGALVTLFGVLGR